MTPPKAAALVPVQKVKTVIGGGSEGLVLCVKELDSGWASERGLVWLIVIVLDNDSSSAFELYKQRRESNVLCSTNGRLSRASAMR